MKYGQAKKIGEACFWLGLMIELLIVIVDKSAYINPLESQLFRLTFLLFCIKIALTKYSTKEWICILRFLQRDRDKKDDEGSILGYFYRLCDTDAIVCDWALWKYLYDC